MPAMVPVGPYKTLSTAEGLPFPYYIIPFDKQGRCEGPATRQHLPDNLAGFSDIFLFSHGWNNDWTAATQRYEHFIQGYMAQRAALGLAAPAGYRPLLVGVFWPSQAMAWFDSETGPGFAAAGPPDVDSGRQLAADLAASLPDTDYERFLDLLQQPALSPQQARELATLLASLARGDDEGSGRPPPDADDLLAAAAALTPAPPDFDEVDAVGNNVAGTPAAAGLGDFFGALDPRNLVKPFTVWQMKDRAGVVGSRGVAALLHELLQRSTARIHLLGHSFGCKVVMSATAALPTLPRKLHSALLLQPAISQHAFARVVPESGLEGGYHKNLAAFERPVVATFSAHDAALTRTYHLALRRQRDLGEQPEAAGTSPSLYGALGGFGPQESGALVLDIKDPGEAYAFGSPDAIVGIRGTRRISGHGDISNAATWWLAHSLAAGH